MASFSDRLKHAWNAFSKEDSEDASPYFNYGMSYGSYGGRPDRIRFGTANDKSIINTIYNQIGIDVASVGLSHVRLDPEKRYIETIDSGLNNCLTLEANLDQAARAFMQDVAMTMFDKGVIAIVPVDRMESRITGAFNVKTLRVGEITAWYPKHVRVSLYNEIKGRKEEVTLAKNFVAIVENPLYMVMNEPNSTLKRLTRKLSLLDSIDEQTGAGKLDLIIQLPYVIKSDARRLQAETRRKDIELQLRGSQYGIAYTDGTERITQLNRPLENNMLKQIEYLTSNLYNQLGMTEAVFNGTADEKTLLNYHNRTIEPILSAIAQAMKRSFLTKTARSQGQSIEFFRDPFKNISISDMAEVADKFTRNEILTSNEVRAAMGLKPANDPKADELRNKNIPEAKQPGFDQSQPEPPSESF